MLYTVTVNNVFNGKDHDFIQYIDETTNQHRYASLPDGILPYIGDIVEMFRAEDLNYRGHNAVVIRIVKEGFLR